MTTTLPAVADEGTPTGSELAGLAVLAGEGAGAVVARVHELHAAIADRAFGPTGVAAAAPRATHDAIAGAVYGGLRAGSRALGAGLARAVAAAGGGPELSAHRRGRLAQGALNGWIGDRLEASRNPLRVELAIRAHHRDVAPDSEGLAAAFPTATDRPVVFVHGLGESDAAWSIRAAEHGGTYMSRVVDQLGGTPVVLRYNSGLRISENGRRLAALLEALVAAWPVPVRDLALVGHSMGGLVIRSAAHTATERGHRWPGLVDSTVGLGTPHLGAPLEQAVSHATAALRLVPETRPLAAVLASRSVGIKDLRHGSVVDAEWASRDPDAVRGFERAEVPLIPGARHHVVAATLTADPRHPVGRMLGDLLVLTASAHGRDRRQRLIAFDEDRCRHVGGHHHFDLLNSPEIDPLLRDWLARG